MQAKYSGKASIIEIFEKSNPDEINGAGPWSGAEYYLGYTTPTKIMTDDLKSASSFAGYPTLPLVDLRTFEVLVLDCWDYPGAGDRDYDACIGDHL